MESENQPEEYDPIAEKIAAQTETDHTTVNDAVFHTYYAED